MTDKYSILLTKKIYFWNIFAKYWALTLIAPPLRSNT